jgi:hypothetical protein
VCQQVISLDGCHLKGVYCKSGVFLTASVKDGSGRNLLVALAIVPVENEMQWTWFLHCIQESPLGVPTQVLFVSDRMKGKLCVFVYALSRAIIS